MNEKCSGFDPVDELVDGFLDRYRRGERPAISEYTRAHPELADRIRSLFPALLMMEEVGASAGGHGDPAPAAAVSGGGVPRRLGDYLLLRPIGSGGMGVVYEAIQESLGRHVALKTLPHHHLADATRLERFRREARAAARLHHTHIVPVFGVGEHDGLHYYIMQFIRGQGLDSVLREVRRLRLRAKGASPDVSAGPSLSATLALGLSTGRFQLNGAGEGERAVPGPTEVSRSRGTCTTFDSKGPDQTSPTSELSTQPEAQYFRSVARIGIQVSQALQYAHEQGILHRDIKPANLLLDAYGEVWVTDFGLAKDQGSDELTGSGELVGTLLYMAPERFQGQCDQRSDVYGLGITLYELVTLKQPYDAADKHTLMKKVLSESPAPVKSVSPTVPHDLETVIEKAIAREPSDRYETAALLADDLQRFLDDKPIHARRATSRERLARWCRKNPWLARSIAAVILLLILVTSVSSASAVWLGRERNRTRAAYLENRRTLYAAQIQLAYRAWEDNQIRRALEMLDSPPCTPGRVDEPLLRGWEWHYLRRLCQSDALTLSDSETELFSVAYSPDGRRLAAGGWDGKVRIWNLELQDHRCVILAGHSKEVHQVAFSRDGRMLASVASDGKVILWNVETLRQERFLHVPMDEVRSVAFSPDGSQIAAAGLDGLIYFMKKADGSLLAKVEAHDARILCVAYSPDGHRLATCAQDGLAKVWDVRTNRLLQTFHGHTLQVSGVTFSPDGQTLATSGQDGTIRLWNADTGDVRSVQSGHDKWVYSVAFSPDGRSIASAGDDGTVRIWSTSQLTEQFCFRGHVGHVRAVAFHPAGRYVASSGEHGTVKFWDLSGGRQDYRSLRGHPEIVLRVVFSHDGSSLASGSYDSTINIWDVASGKISAHLHGHRGQVNALAYGADGGELFSCGTDNTIRLWDTATGRERQRFEGHVGEVRAIAFNGNRNHLASAGDEGTVRIWEKSGEPVCSLPGHSDRVESLAFSRDNRRLVSCGMDGIVRVWDTNGYRALSSFEPAPAPLLTVAFSPDGRLIAAGAENGVMILWDSQTGRIVRSIAAHEGQVTSVCFNRDGDRLVTAGWDQWMKIWDTASGSEILAMKKNVGIYSVSFDPTGQRIALSGHEKPISLYEALSLPSRPAPLVLDEPYRPFVRFTEKMKLPVDPAENKDTAVRLLEGETLVALARHDGELVIQRNMRAFGEQWSRDTQLLWWRTAKGAKLTLVLPAERAGIFEVSAGFTRAPEFGIVSLTIERQLLADRLDFYSPIVLHTDEVHLGRVKLKQGDNRLEVVVLDKNEKSSHYAFGLDWIKLGPVRESGSGK